MATIKITPSQTIEAPTMILNPSNYYSKVVVNGISSYDIKNSNLDYNLKEFSTKQTTWTINKNSPYMPKDPAGNPLPEKLCLTNADIKSKYDFVLYYPNNNLENDPKSPFGFFFLNANNDISGRHIYNVLLDTDNISGDISPSIFDLIKCYFSNITRSISGNDAIYYADIIFEIKFKSIEYINKYGNLKTYLKLNGDWYNYFDDIYNRVTQQGNNYIYKSQFTKISDSATINNLNNYIKKTQGVDLSSIYLELQPQIDGLPNNFYFRKDKCLIAFAKYGYNNNVCETFIPNDLLLSLYSKERIIEAEDESATYGNKEDKNNTYTLSSPIFANKKTTINGKNVYSAISDNIIERYSNKGKVVGQMAIKYTSYNDINGNLVYNENDGKYINVGDTIIPYVLNEKGEEIPFRYKDKELTTPMDFVVMSSELNYENGRTYVLLEFQEK